MHRLRRVGAGVEIVVGHGRVAVDTDAAAQRQCRGGVVIGRAHQAVGGGDRQEHGRPGAAAQDVVVELAPSGPRADAHRDRDRRRRPPHLADDGRQPVLEDAADGRRGVGDLERRRGGRKGEQDLRLRHRHLHRPRSQERVAEGEHPVVIDVGQRADPDHAEVSGRERGADRRAGRQRPRARSLHHPASGGRLETERLEDRSVIAQHAGVATGADQGDPDRLKSPRQASARRHRQTFGPRARRRPRSGSLDRAVPSPLRCQETAEQVGLVGRSRGLPRRARELHHVGDRRDAGDRLLGERAEAIGDRADQLAIDVDRAAAHARDDARVLHLVTVQPGDDHVLLGSDGVLQDAEDLDVELLESVPFEHGPGRALHPRTDLFERQEGDRSRGRRRRSGGGRSASDQSRQHDGGERAAPPRAFRHLDPRAGRRRRHGPAHSSSLLFLRAALIASTM